MSSISERPHDDKDDEGQRDDRGAIPMDDANRSSGSGDGDTRRSGDGDTR